MSGLFGGSKPKTNDAAEQRLQNQEQQAEADNREEQKALMATKRSRSGKGKKSQLMSLQGNPFGDDRRTQLSNQLGAGRKSFSNNNTYGPQN
jgi:hypothetical protein